MAAKPSAKPAAERPLPLADNLCFAVYSTALAFNGVYKPVLDALQLTYPQYLVMLVLWERDGVPVKEIGRRLHLDSGTLTPLLKRLEIAGYVARARNPEDERQLLVTLTAAGRELSQRAGAIPAGIGAACGLSLQDMVALRDQLTQLRDKLNAVTEPA